jgi:hypothetical protein
VRSKQKTVADAIKDYDFDKALEKLKVASKCGYPYYTSKSDSYQIVSEVIRVKRF